MATDPNNKFGILDIRKGSTLSYDFTNWKAVGEYNYFWGEDTYSREFELVNGGKTIFLEIEDEEKNMEVAVSKKIALHRLKPNFKSEYTQGNTPKQLSFNGDIYHFKKEFAAEWRDRAAKGEWEPFTVWDYADVTGKKRLSVEYWAEDDEWEAFVGKPISAAEITNITKPPKKSFSFSGLRKNIGWVIFASFMAMQFLVCSRTCNSTSRTNIYTESTRPPIEGLEDIVHSYASTADFTILLDDMDYENFQFKHKYQILIPTADSVEVTTTDWQSVSGTFFKQHRDHLGMEVATKKDGIVSYLVAPPGYSEYVGNEEYGEWESDSNEQNTSTRRWRFYPRFIYLGSHFNNGYQRANYSNWSQYNTVGRNRTNYLGTNYRYGTNTLLSTNRGRSSRWAQTLPMISKRLEEEKQTSRSSSRYSNRSSRSRSSGFGK
ncbi:MAG: DUF4178 domain-containing protein [Saprospiraceae bacterium]